MTPVEGIYFRSRIIHGDLTEATARLTGELDSSGGWVPHLKVALVALGNLADLEGPLRSLCRDHPDLAAAFRAIEPDLSFAKYLRNVFAGHINEELIAKSYEWRPELRMLPEVCQLNGTILLNLYVLETAINTYVSPDGRHGMFSSETDLVYPPDIERFCGWLRETIRAAQQVCDDLGAITHALVAPLGDGPEMLDAYATAGQTDFARIRKRR